jgi:hypothetical protein
MTRRLSINKRRAYDADNTEEIDVFLLYITHPDLADPIRLSTDPTERLSIDPLAYGTRSTWMDSNTVTEPFQFVIADALFPSDIADAPAEAQISLQIVDQSMVEAMRSFTDKATLNMAHVLASSPSLVEAEWRDLRLNSADIQFKNGEIVLAFSRDDIEEEPHAAETFSKVNFPGLHR